MVDLKYIKRRLWFNKNIEKMNLSGGIENDKSVFVDYDEFRFYSPPTNPKLKKYYALLSRSLKAKLPFPCYMAACDVFIRYVEKGLMIGGPKKESQYAVKEGDIIAEMGAYRGFYTMYLSKKVGSSGKVVAIEAQPENFEFLKKNLDYNSCTNVVPIHKAVWDSKGTVEMSIAEGDGQSTSVDLTYSNSRKIKVPSDRLDNVFVQANLKNIDFILIQLNGAELRAVKSLGEFEPENFTIAARYPESKGTDVKSELVEYLRNQDYIVSIESEDFLYAKKK